MTALADAPAFTLRAYQRECVDAVFEWFRTQSGDCLAVMATGAGKSITMATVVAEARANYPALRVAIIAAQAELVQQNVKAMALLADRRDIGIYSAGLNQKDASRAITVANIQSVAKKAFGLGEPFDLCLIDEAHQISDESSGMYRSFVKAQRMQNPNMKIVGFTATPYKLSSGKLYGGPTSLFDGIAYECDIARLVSEGWLTKPIAPKARVSLDTDGVPMRGGEFVLKALADAVDVEAVTEAAVAEAVRLCEGRKHWLFFAVSVDHARHICEALARHGVSSALIHGELSRDERAHRIEAFKKGEVRAAVGVNILTTGFDHPACDAVVLMRPTASAGLFTQMVGRGMRLAPGKENCLIVDMANLVATHGCIDAIRVRDKKASKDDGEAVVKVCPACESYQPSGVRECRECGHLFPPPPLPLVSTASTAPILSIDVAPSWSEVTACEYSVNAGKLKDGVQKPDTLRCAYKSGFRTVQSEFICIAHTPGSWARRKAEQWWAARSAEPCPATIDDAIALLEADSRQVNAIATRPQRDNPKYSEIVDYRWADAPVAAPSGLPRACWSCLWWDELVRECGKWKATPPLEVQQAGCDAWDDSEPSLPF